MRSDVAQHGPRRGRVARQVALLGTLLAVLTGCSAEEAVGFGWPDPVTTEASAIRDLWTGSTIAALVVGVIVWGLIFWASAFHRRQDPDELPRQTAYNFPLEVGLTIVPLIIVSVLFYFTVVVQNDILRESADPDLTVEVTGFQWNWEFTYPETEVAETGVEVSTLGDSEEVPVLVVPLGDVSFELESKDVIHSFWIPDTLFKRDVIPGDNFGYDNDFVVDFTVPGAYVGRCAELCGIYHYAMNFEVRVVPPDVFEEYLAARESGLSNADALESVGEEPFAQTTEPFDTDRTRRSASDE